MMIDNVVMESVHAWDYPDFCDAYIAAADRDGVPLTDEELDGLNTDSCFVNEQAHKSLH